METISELVSPRNNLDFKFPLSVLQDQVSGSYRLLSCFGTAVFIILLELFCKYFGRTVHEPCLKIFRGTIVAKEALEDREKPGIIPYTATDVGDSFYRICFLKSAVVVELKIRQPLFHQFTLFRDRLPVPLVDPVSLYPDTVSQYSVEAF